MNAVGVKLGNGWYSAEQHGAVYYGKKEYLLFRREILLND